MIGGGILSGVLCGGLVAGITIPSLPASVVTGSGLDGESKVLVLAVESLGGSCAANNVSGVQLLAAT